MGACQSKWSDPGLKIIILVDTIMVDIIMKIQLSVQHQIQDNQVSGSVLTPLAGLPPLLLHEERDLDAAGRPEQVRHG